MKSWSGLRRVASRLSVRRMCMPMGGGGTEQAHVVGDDALNGFHGVEQLAVERVGEQSEVLVAAHVAALAACPFLEVEALLLERRDLLLVDALGEAPPLVNFGKKEVAAAWTVVEHGCRPAALGEVERWRRLEQTVERCMQCPVLEPVDAELHSRTHGQVVGRGHGAQAVAQSARWHKHQFTLALVFSHDSMVILLYSSYSFLIFHSLMVRSLLLKLMPTFTSRRPSVSNGIR